MRVRLYRVPIPSLPNKAAHPGPASAEPAGVNAGWGAAANGKVIGLEPIAPGTLLTDNLASTMASTLLPCARALLRRLLLLLLVAVLTPLSLCAHCHGGV